MTFITTHLVNNKEQAEMRKAFENMDKNFDGKLSKDELVKGFKEMDIENYEEEADKIFKKADFDDNGSIEFSEWCTASMDKRQMLSKERLKAAFAMFDVNGNGMISFDEVRQLLDHSGQTESKNDLYKSMIEEMDIDGDGEISFPEFEKMMKLLIA